MRQTDHTVLDVLFGKLYELVKQTVCIINSLHCLQRKCGVRKPDMVHSIFGAWLGDNDGKGYHASETWSRKQWSKVMTHEEVPLGIQ